MKYTLGIGVGGTKIAAGLVDSTNNVSQVKILSTSQSDLRTQLTDLILSFSGFEAIGLGLPGQVLPSGEVVRLPNIPKFERQNLKAYLGNKFSMPISIINDAKAFALAEATVGIGRHSAVVVGLILGTGIGAGVVMNKKIYFGKDGLAGELEHVTLVDGRMIRDYRHEAGKFKAAKDAQAYLKTILSMIVLSFNPDIIVLGGSWSNLPDMEDVAEEIVSDAGQYANLTPVKVSTLEHAGVIGAAIALNKQA